MPGSSSAESTQQLTNRPFSILQDFRSGLASIFFLESCIVLASLVIYGGYTFSNYFANPFTLKPAKPLQNV